MFSFSLSWKAIFGLIGLAMIGGFVLYFNHLQGKVADLEQKVQVMEQKEKALAGSLKVVRDNYQDSLGVLRTLRSRVNTPVDEGENIIDDENVREEIGEAQSKTETSFSLSEDSVSGKSGGKRVENYWEHDITRSTDIYNFHVHLSVWPPGDSLDYTISASTKEIRLSFFQYKGPGGFDRTGADAPSYINFSGLDTYYRPDRPEESDSEYENVKIEAPLFTGSLLSGVRIGAGLVYRTNSFLGARFMIRGGVTAPILGVPQPIDDVPPVLPRVSSGIVF